MSDQKVLFAQTGKLGEIKLNRPKALNSLDLDMIDAMAAQLTKWEQDQSVSLILLSGEGEKGFCAGGDVKAVRVALQADGVEGAVAFFDREYKLYQRLARSNIPVISLQHGFVMGGGIGLSGFSHLRLVREGARFAMPEKSIGFFTDVAVNQLVKAAPLHQRVAFLLTGDVVGPADAIALNLSDILIAEEDWAKVPQLLVHCADQRDPLAAAKMALSPLAQKATEAPFVAWANRHKALFEQAEVQDIVEGLAQADDERAKKLHAALLSASPTSLVSTFLLVHRSATVNNMAQQIALESELARFIVGQPDFAEGVRAVLVDKDSAPNWTPASIGAVSREKIRFLLS